nr:BamA/TamA family outer membrane protein [Burkholderiaceae bacterium]
IEGLPAGACGPAGESVTVHPLSVQYVAQSGGAVAWGINAWLIRNLDLGGTYGGDASFEAVRTGATADFMMLRAGGFVGTALFEDWQVQARAAGQWTDDALVPGEQFGIGGASTVRGYQEREVVGDRGALVTLELSSPPLANDQGASLRFVAFLDAGAVQNMMGAQCLEGRTSCRLAGTGLGGRLNVDSVQLSLMAGYALRDGAITDKDSVRLHVAFSFGF